MSIQHNDSLSLDWLMPIFKEYMDRLSAQWQDYQDDVISAIPADMAQDYQQLSGAMTLANLPLFANLAKALNLLTLHITESQLIIGERPDSHNSDNTDIKDLASMAYGCHKLLWIELEKYTFSSRYHQQLLITSIQDIAQLLSNDELLTYTTKAKDFAEDNTFNENLSELVELPAIAKEILHLESEQKQKIKEAWQYHYQQLLTDNNNQSVSVEQLYKMTQFVWRSCQVQLLQRLWYLATLWLRCLSHNDTPRPSKYSKLLTELDKVLATTFSLDLPANISTQDELVCESLIAELYVQINLLNHLDEETQTVIKNLQVELPQKVEFFANILQKLEKVLFHLQEPEQVIDSLVEVKQQLDHRGWAVYVTYLELIIDDLQRIIDSKNDDAYAHTQWQIERQLQELYGAVFGMKQSIGNELKQSGELSESSDQSHLLRQVRIAIETIKTQFRDYTSSHNLANLPTVEFLDTVSDNLSEMQLSEAVEVVDKLKALFERFHENNLQKVSWTVLGATVDSIAEFELFFDHLAQQVLDTDRLNHTLERIEQTNALIDHFLQEDSPVLSVDSQDNTVIRYSDSGEIQPVDMSSSITESSNASDDSNAGVVSPNEGIELDLGLNFDNEAGIDLDLGDSIDMEQEFEDQSGIDIDFDIDEKDKIILTDEPIDESFTLDFADDLNFSKDSSDNHNGLFADKRKQTDEPINDLSEIDLFANDDDLEQPVVTDNEINLSNDLDDDFDTVEQMIVPPASVSEDLDQEDTLEDNDSSTDSDEADADETLDTISKETNDLKSTSPALEKARQALKDDDFSMDEDIREIFIEEAEEVLESMDEQLPTWQNNPEDLDTLKEIRRGFHTLKGSGRMVGANNVGEMSWAVENMLNRVLENTVPVTDELVTLIADTKADIPTLVKDFANQQPPSVDPAITVLKANNLLAGRDINEGLPSALLTSTDEQSKATDTEVTDATTDLVAQEAEIEETESKIESKTETSAESGFAVGNVTLPLVLQPFWEEAQNLPLDTSEMDEDIKEIFIEEAGEVLETIVPEFTSWSVDTDNNEKLTEIRRGFHTLKGSGRMVGANYSAELAWAIENMLNRVLDNTIEINSGILALTKDVLLTYPQLVSTFEQGNNDYPEILSLWVACANAYSKNLGNKFNYQALSPYFLTDAIDEGGQIAEDSSRSSQSDKKVLDSIQDINETLDDAIDLQEQNFSKGEREFIDIFVDEANDRLAIINNFVKENQDKKEIVISDDVVRAFHTLRGASGSPALHDISEVSRTIETNLVHLQHNESTMTEQHLQAIAQSSALIGERLANYQDSIAGQAIEPIDGSTNVEEIQSLLAVENEKDNLEADLSVRTLIEDLDELLESEWELEYKLHSDSEQRLEYAQRIKEQLTTLQSRTLSSNSFQSLLIPLADVYQAIIKTPELAEDESILLALISAHEQLTNLFDALAGNMSLQVDKQVIIHLNEISADTAFSDEKLDNEKPSIQEHVQDVGVSELDGEDDDVEVKDMVSADSSELDEVSTPTEPVSTIEFETIETDAELLEIFLEEAQELETDITSSFATWRKEPNNLDTLKELQRHLHTIKGGARMAGISSIGDLTHEMETIYEKFVNQDMIPSEPWLNIMQSAQDTLSMQIEYMKTHHKSFFTTDLIEQLLAFAKLDELPADARLVVPVLESEVVEDQVVQPTEMHDDSIEDEIDDVIVNFNKLVLNSWNGTLPDEDILEVFLEESDELIESTAQHLQGFISNTGNLSNLQALQRELHTIKGGARMVGTNSIADLSHEMETIYEGLGGRQLPATKKVTELLVTCHDWLSGSIQLLKHNVNPPMPTALIKALKQFHHNPDALVDIPIISLEEYHSAIATYEAYRLTLKGNHDTTEMPAMVGNFGDFKESTDVSNEVIRVSSGLMEQMINLSGESAINRARVDMGISSLTGSIEEMGTTVQRLADQLRRMDIELEAQILAQIDDETLLENEDFDPLEMDQYSSLNQLSKSLSESASDLLDIKSTLLEKTRDSENLLLQLSRTQTELQDSLMSSRMVPFSRLIPRLQRIVRQTANEVNKNVELKVLNADDEMDRSILERITSPLEHMLRNAVDHGIELPEEREQLGKDKVGKVALSVSREGSELVIQLSDDGHGINVESVRKKAISQGLIDPNDDSLTDADVMQYIFNAGLSTTKKVTQISGRGVGMDVVRSEIRQLGGTVSVESTQGKGSRFIMRVPLTVAVSDALIVRTGEKRYVIPLVQIERVEQVSPDDLFKYYQSDSHTFNIFGTDYRLRYLNEILTGNTTNDLSLAGNSTLPVIIIKNQTGQNLALQVDEIVGSRQEVVVKPLGKQLSHVSGVSAATIMGDGSVMLILDLIALIRNAPIRKITKVDQQPTVDVRKKVLVIDDSVTVRKVTSRFLEREGFDAHVAKDGVDALRILQEFTPDLMLLDIEMPRMDGFEVATQVRHNERLKDTPIIMITSRTGDKHRERAMEVGVNDYLGKPFQESVLLERISSLLGLELVISDDK